jgi:acylphosphatase
VQGVFFRGTTLERARELGLRGYVRNLPDGRLEALFEGQTDAVEAGIAFVREGPPHARVAHVEVRYEPYTGEYSGFELRYS